MSLEKYICRTAGCPVYGDWAIANKYKVGWDKVQRGDSLLFDINHNGTSDHVGIVTKVGDGYVETIEANTGSNSVNDGDGVWRKTRKKSSGLINYFVHPPLSKAQRESLIRVAESQVGYQEGRNNNNKYGKWYGANYQPYCMIFVYWCYCHASGEELKPVDKPTGKYSGTLPTTLVKYGTKGNDTLLWQKFLNFYHPSWKLAEDGECGSATTEATSIFQLTEGITADGEAGKNTYAKAKAYLNEEKQGYGGTFPTLPIKVSTTRGNDLADKAKALAWALGTPVNKYKFNGGSPTSKCKSAMQKRGYKTKVAFSDCGYFQNSIIYAVLGNKVKVLGAGSAAFKPVSGFKVVHNGKITSGILKAGDIIRYKYNTKGKQHTLMYLGNGVIAEAGRKSRFGRMIKSEKYNASKVNQSSIQVLRAIEGTKEKAYLSNGDKCEDVGYLQSYLKWYGIDISVDKDFGDKTEKAVRQFQTNEGLTVDGAFGKDCLAKAKEITK